MGYLAPINVDDSLYPSGWRKTLAMLLFFATTTMPSVFVWQYPNRQPPIPVGVSAVRPWEGPTGRTWTYTSQAPVGARSQMYISNFPSNKRPSPFRWLGSFFRLSLAVLGGILSLALYYPFSGFKRFAVLCGPIVGLGSMIALGMYLFARTEVYRFEIAFAAICGALPGVALYAILVYTKANRLANQPVDAQVYSSE